MHINNACRETRGDMHQVTPQVRQMLIELVWKFFQHFPSPTTSILSSNLS